MEMTTTTTINRNPRRAAAISALALVGFITLIALGIMLAIYSARFVPAAVSRVGSAAVQLSQIFVPAPKSDLTVVPQLPFEESTTTATSTIVTSPLLNGQGTDTTVPAATTPGQQTSNTYPVGGASNAPLYGQSDLAVTITQVGYLSVDNTDSFIASSNVPSGFNAAVKFSVRNTGTNATGGWSFNAVLPTSSSYTFNSDQQKSLLPGEHIDYTLGFDRTQSGARTITITVDQNNQISESSEANNSAAQVIQIN